MVRSGKCIAGLHIPWTSYQRVGCAAYLACWRCSPFSDLLGGERSISDPLQLIPEVRKCGQPTATHGWMLSAGCFVDTDF